MCEEKSVIHPGDIPVKAKKYKTVLSPVVSDLAALILKDIDPLEMDVQSLLSKPVDYALLKPIDAQEAKGLSTRVDRKLGKYQEEK